MPTKLDPAIIRALSIDASTTRISSHGGSGFSSTHRITTPTTSIFVKQSNSADAAVMFEGEYASLNAINSIVPNFCPKSFAWGPLDSGGYFLATEFLDLSPGSSRVSRSPSVSKGSGMSLAQKLAKLHSTPAPTPSGYEDRQFGFPVTTCCGETLQPNPYRSSWADFFAENRLVAVLERAERNQGKDSELRNVVEETVEKVVPRLLSDGHLGGKDGIVPVVVHGDLWSGNKGFGVFVGRNHADSSDSNSNSNSNTDVLELGSAEHVVFDPSSTYAHSEFDHGIMNMFGGFGTGFWKEYFDLVPKTEPRGEYEDRVKLYEAYHHLNHYAMFGGGYKGGVVGLLRPLVRKYGE